MECLESRQKYGFRNNGTGTCKIHKSYNEMNAFWPLLEHVELGRYLGF